MKQAVMSNWDSESLPQEKGKMASPLEKVRHEPKAEEGGRMERWSLRPIFRVQGQSGE